jgi:uncharacterized membrane protein
MDGIGTNRLEAFSDGVIAVIITIMVLELKPPRDTSLASLRNLAPEFLSYLLSFLVVAIMWVNHHHMLHAARRADARLLWSNNALLFWMSLVPFVTAYMGDHSRDPRAVAVYGVVLSLCSVSFAVLRSAIIEHHRDNPEMVRYHRRIQSKNLQSLLLYLASIPLRSSMFASHFLFLCLLRSPIFFPNGSWRKRKRKPRPRLAGRSGADPPRIAAETPEAASLRGIIPRARRFPSREAIILPLCASFF